MKRVVLSFVLFFSPTVVFGGEGFVQCTGSDCDLCDFVLMIENIIDWLTILSITIATIIFAYAGFRLTASGGDTGAVKDAKDKMVNVVIGVIIILAAYTIIDTVMKVLVNDSFGPWNQTECGSILNSGTAQPLNLEYEVDQRPAEQEDQATAIDGLSNVQDLSAAGVSRASRSNPSISSIPQPSGSVCYPGSGANTPFCLPAVSNPPDSNLSVGIDADLYSGEQISPNFTLGELNVSASCGRGGRYIYISPDAVQRLEQVRSIIGQPISINSGYRSPSCNTQVGGASQSQHMAGLAFDIQPPGGRANRQQVINACCSAGASYVAIYNSTSHVHCDWRGGNVGSSLCN